MARDKQLSERLLLTYIRLFITLIFLGTGIWLLAEKEYGYGTTCFAFVAGYWLK